jgi:PAS domain S-box-containing protein
MSSAGHLSELDLLRCQVADLSRQLVERDRSMQDLREQSQLLRTIAEGTASETGDEFFASLVTHLTSMLHVQYAVISEVLEVPFRKIRTLAVSAGGALADNFEYELAQTPCATALTQTFTCFNRDLQATFPQFQRLADLGAESYCAVPLRTKGGAVIGLLVVMDTKPLENSDDLQSLLGVLALRIVAEFERKRAEQESAQALADLHNVIETIPDIVFALNTQGNLVKWNRRLEDVTGYSHEELLNMPALAFVPPEEHIPTAAAIERAFTEGYAELEGHLSTREHSLIPYHWIGALLKNPHGEPVGITGIGRDVSEKKRAEEVLRESEERYRTLIDLSPNGVFVYCNGKKVYVNQTACTILGASSPEQLIENPTFHFSHPDACEAIHTSLAQILATGEPVRRVERKYQRLDGTAVFVEVDAGRIMWNGEPAVQVIFADITHRKQAEEALRESEAFNISVLNSLSSQIVVLNSQGVIMAVNKPWLQFAEENEASHLVEKFVGMNYLNVCAQAPLFANGEEAALAQAGILAVLAGRQNEFYLEYPCHSPDQQRWFRMRVTPLHGSQAGVVVAHENISERKQAQEIRYQSEVQLQAILDNSPSLIFLKDLDGRYLRVNREFESFFGTTEVETVGRTDRDIFPPEQAAVFQGNDKKVLQGGMAMLFEEETVCGNNRHVSIVQKFPLRDKEGALYAIGGIATNITERKRAEEALREREEALARFKVTLDQTHDCVFMFAPDTLRFIYCNRGAIEHVGYTEAELFTMTPIDIKPEFTEQSFRELLDSLRDGSKSSCVFETVHRHKGGHDMAVEVSLQLVREQGVEGRFVAVVRDITHRKQAEEALRASEERFDLAVRGSNTGIWDWDLRTGKTYFSPLWISMLGYEEHELKGEFFEWEERLHPDDRERSSAAVRAYLEGTTPQYVLEHRLRHKDGSYRWILARGVSIRDTEGKPYRMAGSHIDITEQKQTQEALAQSERQLRTVLNALPVGVWFTDRAGKPLLANPAAKQIWSNIKQIGLQTENPQAGWWETIGPANEPHRWALSHVLTTGVPSLNETLDFECLDGTMKTVRNSTVPVKNEDGVILGAIVLNEDITTLRQAQAALQLTQFSVDHAVEGFLWIGPDARIFHVNDSICRMLEYTWEEFTTMTLHDIDPNLTSEVWPAHWEELKEKGSLTFESKYWSRTGRVLDMEVTVNYLQYEGKEYNCTIMRDIGERKRAEEALRQSEERYRSLVDNAPIGIFLNEAGRFVYANREMLRILNAPNAEQLIGTPVLDRIAPEFHTLVKDRIHELTMGQSVPILDEKFVRLDGSQIDVAVSASPTSLVGNPVIQVLALDITERKHMEEALRQRERALQTAIEERERISQDLHDGILQSLFAVGLALESAKLTMPTRTLKVSRASLNQAIDQLNDVMREIRNFIAGLGSDLLQGKNLPAALKQMLASLTEHQAMRVRLAVEDRAVKALSTEQSLHLVRVIQEAVSNCIKHGHAQETRVSLKMLKQGVRLSVRDNGRGFNQATAKRTGHGLTNMAARAQKIGGRFTILSKVNEGTSIVLDLPKEAADVSR